jgi:hypothetical protein
VKPEPSEVQAGAEATITLSVPNECAAPGGTDGLRVQLPEGASDPVPGEVEGFTSTVEADVVSWSGGLITGDTRVPFPLTLTMPDTPGETVLLATIQHCSDGVEFAWIEATPPGGAEPEFPAPAVVLTATGATAGATVDDHTDDTADDHADDTADDHAEDTTALAETTISETEATLVATATQPEIIELDSADTTVAAGDEVAGAASGGDDDGSSAGLIVGIVAAVVVIGGGAVLMLRARSKPAA